jgi:hypothetical protein
VKPKDPEVCSIQDLNYNWHYVFEDIFKPASWFNTNCSEAVSYKNYDFQRYFDIIKESGKNTTKIEF